MFGIAQVLDVLIVGAALLSAWLWWVASRHRMRRISRHEVLDAADMNRLVTAMNRTQILNSRAASRPPSRPSWPPSGSALALSASVEAVLLERAFVDRTRRVR